MRVDARDDIEALLAEQVSYYRARAPEYLETVLPELDADELGSARAELLAALETFHPSGDVLELACGPGTWTEQLAGYAANLTAVDVAPEMLAIAAAKVGDDRVRFLQRDVFTWEPDRRYDVVFFGFWLSHVPSERFDSFWRLVANCLKPGGRVFFVDDNWRTPEETIEGADPTTIRRRLVDGTPYRAVKVQYAPEELERRLALLGWRISVTAMPGPFYRAEGERGRNRTFTWPDRRKTHPGDR
jgi:demethylmenaquinone methyltransferase/2-methoxy-6-polyprenyl-1,4-benzoquinol methylase